MGNFLKIRVFFEEKTEIYARSGSKNTSGDEESLSCVTTHEYIDKRQLSRLMSL
jgi:hypothetical protein